MEQKSPEWPYRLLIVDDHPIVREGISSVIYQTPDMEVCGEVGSAVATLSTIDSTNPDVIILDLALPDGDGLELIKRIRRHRPELPILVLSMYDEVLYAERAIRAGARGYIMKQEGGEKLLVAIRDVLRDHVYVSEKIKDRLSGQLGQNLTKMDDDPVTRLSNRELGVLRMLGQGLSTREVADNLALSLKTVETYRERIKMKMGFGGSTELLRYAIRFSGG